MSHPAPTGPTGPSGPTCNINPSAPSSEGPNSTFDMSKPWALDPSKCEDDSVSEEQDKAINEWIKKMQKDVSELLEANGITEYQLSFSHEGTKQLVMLSRGAPYDVAILACDAANALRSRVLERLRIR